MPRHILIINGPNLNLLGTREPQHYGADTLADICARLDAVAAELGVRVSHFQHNGEGEIVSRIHAARSDTDMVIINAGAYTHTSIAVRDALAGTGLPFVEVHLSNVYRREPFRHHSYLADLAEGVIAGLGAYGYEAALRFAAARLQAA